MGVWLDIPMIDIKHGDGTIMEKIPAMFKMFDKYGIDIRKEPILVYPTLHYQNGGLEIDDKCEVRGIKNLYAAGEVAGGIHGKNRLMGNSLLDIIVFGRAVGKNAAKKAKNMDFAKNLSLKHIEDYDEELKKAGIKTDKVSPMLFPDYRKKANYLIEEL